MNIRQFSGADCKSLLPAAKLPRTVRFGNVSFALRKNGAGFDTVVCAAQEIPLNVTASSLCLLGFSTWGSYSEYMDIHFSSGESELREFGFYDVHYFDSMRQAKLHPKDQMPFEKGCRQVEIMHDDRGQPEAALFFYRIRLSRCAEVSRIVLPDNEYISILAVTAETAGSTSDGA